MYADFLAAICEEPEDMTHRLVYADWLEEHGEQATDAAHAELIRVQIALERVDPDEDAYWSLRARERWLLARWGTGLAGAAGAYLGRYRFRRGFIEWGEIDAGMLEQFAERILRLTPLRAVKVTGRFPATHVLRRFQEIDLSRVFGTPGPIPLAEALALDELRSLTMSGTWVDQLAPLVREGMPALEHLDLTVELPPGSAEQLIRLLDAPPAGLRDLGFQLNHWEDETRLPRILNTQGFGGLERLAMQQGGGTVVPSVLHELSISPQAARLRELCLLNFTVNEAVLSGPFLSGLRSLEVENAWMIWPAGADWLCRLGLSELRRLRISRTTIPEATAESLFRCPYWPRLHTLEMLPSETLHPRSYEALIEGPHLPRLRRLELATIDGASLQRLVLGQRPGSGGDDLDLGRGPERLSELLVENAHPGVRMEPFLRSPYMNQLTWLQLRNIDESGPMAIPAGVLPRLTSLDLFGVPIASEVISSLRARFGAGLRIGRTQQPRVAHPAPDEDIPF